MEYSRKHEAELVFTKNNIMSYRDVKKTWQNGWIDKQNGYAQIVISK